MIFLLKASGRGPFEGQEADNVDDDDDGSDNDDDAIT